MFETSRDAAELSAIAHVAIDLLDRLVETAAAFESGPDDATARALAAALVAARCELPRLRAALPSEVPPSWATAMQDVSSARSSVAALWTGVLSDGLPDLQRYLRAHAQEFNRCP